MINIEEGEKRCTAAATNDEGCIAWQNWSLLYAYDMIQEIKSLRAKNLTQYGEGYAAGYELAESGPLPLDPEFEKRSTKEVLRRIRRKLVEHSCRGCLTTVTVEQGLRPSGWVNYKGRLICKKCSARSTPIVDNSQADDPPPINYKVEADTWRRAHSILLQHWVDIHKELNALQKE